MLTVAMPLSSVTTETFPATGELTENLALDTLQAFLQRLLSNLMFVANAILSENIQHAQVTFRVIFEVYFKHKVHKNP